MVADNVRRNVLVSREKARNLKGFKIGLSKRRLGVDFPGRLFQVVLFVEVSKRHPNRPGRFNVVDAIADILLRDRVVVIVPAHLFGGRVEAVLGGEVLKRDAWRR
jgi:hypothetical protein